MNFVGHVIVARWEDSDPRHGLGAMLPDLARMCGAATPGTPDLVIARGVRCHHRVDAAFHDAPAFIALMQAARRWLGEAGVPRASTLAAAHVGVELLLDGVWMAEHADAGAFAEAVGVARSLSPTAIAWPDVASCERFDELCARLPEIARGYVSPVIVGDRLLRILARRPRLCAPPSAAAAIRAWAVEASPHVAAASHEVLAQLRARLEAA